MQATNASNQIMWKQFFRDAVLELNPGIFEHKLDAAHKAIQDRMLELRSSGSADRQELIELTEAERTILFLKKQEQPK
ncbi:MAG: hypothetical protein DMG73_07225 [Acidobacteria bacterium]|nr:MAG: hypothetical protein DMG73_07225 [Acidobacteriota bacterium]PYX63839.1 MAG: hypothetical protein DMG74_15425 [Acidobacteriota bacterium]